MTNAECFKDTFGLYATELWSMPEEEFLKWLNEEHEVFNTCSECHEFVCDCCKYAN